MQTKKFLKRNLKFELTETQEINFLLSRVLIPLMPHVHNSKIKQVNY